MRLIEHKELWERIQGFNIDDQASSIKFSDKLSFQNNWSSAYTEKVIREYKKFIFLCCISPQGASPSADIDEAWHLHLTYTQSYWKEFCDNTLRQPVHHHPSKGGEIEKARHNQWYEATLQLYKDVFEEEPPNDVWPAPRAERFASTVIPETIKKPPLQKIFLLLIAPFVIPLFYATSNPFQLTGPKFLVFYAGLIVAFAISLWLIYQNIREQVRTIHKNNYKGDANVYQLTRFAFGRNRSLQTAIVDLVTRQILTAERKAQFTFNATNYRYSTNEENPLIRQLLKGYEDGERISYENLARIYDDEATYHEGLAQTFKTVDLNQYWIHLPAFIIVLIGIARLIQGVNHDKPVNYLLIMMIMMGFIYIIVFASIRPKAVFGALIKEGYEDHTLGQPFTVSSTVNQFAFLGFIALGTDYYVTNLEAAFKTKVGGGGGESSGGGCGSSGCGGSCGGGCGGCGGGD
ncbi:MAG TPA: hypothetical protein VF476_17870 [Chitinophagaceae bacterium]